MESQDEICINELSQERPTLLENLRLFKYVVASTFKTWFGKSHEQEHPKFDIMNAFDDKKKPYLEEPAQLVINNELKTELSDGVFRKELPGTSSLGESSSSNSG